MCPYGARIYVYTALRVCVCVCDVCRHRVQHRRRHPTFTHITDGDGADGEEALGHACANPKWFHKCGTPIFFPSFPFFLSIHATHLIIEFIKLNRHSVTLRIVHSHTTRNRKKKESLYHSIYYFRIFDRHSETDTRYHSSLFTSTMYSYYMPILIESNMNFSLFTFLFCFAFVLFVDGVVVAALVQNFNDKLFADRWSFHFVVCHKWINALL